MGPTPYQPPYNPGFGGYQPSLPNHGAGCRYPEYGQIQQHAREIGTLDGTPVTPQSSFQEDQFHVDALVRLNQRAAGRVMDEARTGSPREFNALQRNEGQLQNYLQQQAEQGIQYPGSQVNRLRAEGIENLYQDGQVGQGIGQANREYMELLEAWERSEANQQLKYGAGPMAGLPARAYQESPFNPERQVTRQSPQGRSGPEQGAQQRPPDGQPPTTARQLQDVRRLDPPNAKPGSPDPVKPVAPHGATASRPPVVDKKAYDVNKDSNELYTAMHGGVTGWGTDETALFKALDGKNKDQINKLKSNYKDHYGKDLVADLKSELSGQDYQRAEALLKSNQSAADATTIQQSVGTFWNDDKQIQQSLTGKSAEQRKAIGDEYKKQTGKELKTELTRQMSGTNQDEALALLDGNNAKADAAKLQRAMKGMGTDEATIMSTLEGKSADERKAISEAYQEQYGGNKVGLQERLKGDLGGSELDQANALMKGKQAEATAAKIKTSADGFFGADKTGINDSLQGKSAEERKAITDAYKQTYGTELKAELKGKLSGNDLQKSEALLQRGKLSEAEQLKFALEGAGTDEEAVKQALQGKTKEEVAQIRSDYHGLTQGRKLDADIADDLSGREHFDIKQALKGRAETVEEAVDRANEVHAYERKGDGNSISRGLVDLVSDKGELLDKNTGRVNESKAKFDHLVSMGRLDEAKIEKKRLQELTSFTTADVESYREAKDSAADTAGTVAATAAGVAVVVASAGTATPLVAVATMAAGAGAGARVVASGAIQGEGYGWESAVSDVARGAVDGGTSIIGMGAGKVATKEVAEQTLGRRIIQAGTHGMKDGLKGGAAGAGASEAIADGNWDNGLIDGLQRVATSTAAGAITGAVASSVMSGGMVAGKEAALGVSHAAHDAAATLRTAGQEAAGTFRTVADDASARWKSVSHDAARRPAGQDVKTATRDAISDYRNTHRLEVKNAPPEVRTTTPGQGTAPQFAKTVSADAQDVVPEHLRGLYQDIQRSDQALARSGSALRRGAISHEGGNYLLYGAGEDGIPKDLEVNLKWMNKLTDADKRGMCLYRTEDMINEGLATDHILVDPRVDDNIRGVPGFHYLSGKQLADGRYALFDPTWPNNVANSIADGQAPHGVVIVGRNQAEAFKAAGALYGDKPVIQ